MKKWTKSIVLTLCISLSGFTVYAEGEPEPLEEKVIYQDVEGHWAEEAIEALFDSGSLRITVDQLFEPDHDVSRAHFLYMLLTTKGITPSSEIKQINFKDVAKDTWYYPYVETAYRLGIIHGSNNYFYPDQSITREEALVMLVRTLGDGQKASQFKEPPSLSTAFKDWENLSDWADETVAYAVNEGFFQGIVKEDGKYIMPKESTSRGEAAVLIYKSLFKRMDYLQKEDVDGIPIVYSDKIEVEATAYNKQENSNRTALGWAVREGIVAVDPNVIPYGTHLYIPGYGYAVAADRGSSIKNLKVDVYMDSYQEALQFGRKKGFTVYILDPIEITN